MFVMLGASFILPLAVAVALGKVWLLQALGQFSTDVLQMREHVALGSAAALRAHAMHVAREVDLFFLERLHDTKALASERSLIVAARQGAEAHQAQGLSDMSIDEVEVELQASRSLRLYPNLDLYLLHHVSSNPFFLSAAVTDRFGFNVAMSHSMPDFVQRDEQWWQMAWKTGLDVGHAEFHLRAPVKSLSIAMRIEEPISKRRLGVLHVSVDVNYVQLIMDSAARSAPGIEVSVFAPGGKRVAAAEMWRSTKRIVSRAAGEGAQPSGIAQDLVDSDTVVEFARTTAGPAYRSLRADYGGLGWKIQVKGQPGEMYPSFDPLTEILQETTTWPRYLPVLSGAVGLGVLGICLAIVWMLSLRLSMMIRSAQYWAPTHRRKERDKFLIASNSKPHSGHDRRSATDAGRRSKNDGQDGQDGQKGQNDRVAVS